LRDDPVVRSRIARAVTELEVARMLQRRVISAALRDRVPTIEASEYKLYMNECGKRVANTALDLMGPEGALRAGEEGAALGGRFERSYRYTVVDTIGGGTSEIQKNIIASRGLGLPRSF
jgi:alkylation response protein AidB-like acyl-CoA dehydrogenase